MTTRQQVRVHEVGPRDGIQNEKRILPVEARIELINRLSVTGVNRIEVGSFVSATAVPQMANTDAVFAGIKREPGVEYIALALNQRGTARAVEAAPDRINFAIAATDTFNLRNQRATVEASLEEFAKACDTSHRGSIPITATIAVAFGCPFEGATPTEAVFRLAEALHERGADEISLADTIGVGVPAQVETLIAGVRERLPSTVIGAHFHDTRSTGIANADAAIRSGVAWLDASVGGFGGCPFAPNATGNIASEDLGYLIRQSGLTTSVDIEKLAEIGRWLGEQLGKPGNSAIGRAGAFPECVAARV